MRFFFTTLLLGLIITTSTRAEITDSVAPRKSIDSIFISAPNAELAMLDLNSRLDMVDLYNYNMTAKSENIFSGLSILQEKSNNFIRIQLTDVSTWELMRLYKENEDIYACIYTLTYPTTQSRIRFYAEDWSVEDDVALPQLCLDDFCQTTDSISTERAQELRAKLTPMYVGMTWEKEDATSLPTLKLAVTTANLSSEDQADATKCLHSISLVWDGKAFIRQ